MGNLNDEILKQMIRATFANVSIRGIDVGGSTPVNRDILEGNCETRVTDEDMLKLHIDIALQNGDKEQFYALTEQLKKMEKVVRNA